MQKQFERPDPSQKVNCGQDRPIKMNPSGKYNLNFIDWDNEWEAIAQSDPYSDECPIAGMDP